MLSAPLIDRYIEILDDHKLVPDKKSKSLINKIYKLIDCIEPEDFDDRKIMWLKTTRGTPDDFKKRMGFKSDFKSFYPEEVVWYKAIFGSYEGRKYIFLNNDLIHDDAINGFEYEMSDLYTWIYEAVKDVIKEMEDGSYNLDVYNNLSIYKRNGIISRKDYYEVFKDERKEFLDNFTKKDIKDFVKNISGQTSNYPVGQYKETMCADDYYRYCAIVYKAIKAKGYNKLDERKMRGVNADHRNADLDKIDGKSNEEFEKWLNKQCDHHRFEITVSGLLLFVEKNTNGYYLTLSSHYYNSKILMVKAYNALRKEGIAVYIYNYEEVLDDILLRGAIGILNEDYYPISDHSLFPKELDLNSFINLPEGKENKKILDKIIWLKEKPLRFKSPYMLKMLKKS